MKNRHLTRKFRVHFIILVILVCSPTLQNTAPDHTTQTQNHFPDKLKVDIYFDAFCESCGEPFRNFLLQISLLLLKSSGNKTLRSQHSFLKKLTERSFDLKIPQNGSSKVLRAFDYTNFFKEFGTFFENHRSDKPGNLREFSVELYPFREGTFFVSKEKPFFVCVKGKEQCQMDSYLSCIKDQHQGTSS